MKANSKSVEEKSGMTRLEYTFKTDTLFKMLFVQYPHLLKHLVATLLAIPLESIGQFEVTNPDIPPDSKGEKFCPLEVTRHELLSDKMSLHFFELKKLPAAELNASNKLLLWLSLFKANTEEELEQIKALEEPTMEQAINAYQKITATDEFKERERLRHYARINEASALYEAREQEREKWQGVVADKDAKLADKDAKLADKDAKLADKDAENERLRLQIAELQAKIGG